MNTEHTKQTAHQKVDEKTEKFKAQAHGAMERGAEAYEKAEKTAGEAYDQASHKVGEAYDHASHKVGEAYHQARDFSYENPGKTMLIGIGIGIGIGFLLGASSRRPRSRRYAIPVVNALSDIAMEVFR